MKTKILLSAILLLALGAGAARLIDYPEAADLSGSPQVMGLRTNSDGSFSTIRIPAELFLGITNGLVKSGVAITTFDSFGFTNLNTLATGLKASSLCADDFNGDGKIDLAAVVGTNDTLYVYTNSGGGHFVISQTFVTGDNPVFVTSGDLTGNGRPDLAVVNQGGTSDSIFTNNGTGIFSLSQTLAELASPMSCAIMDTSGEGLNDLVVVNESAALVKYWHNNGGGILVGAGSSTISAHGVGSVVGDFDGDGKPDLAVACPVEQSVVVLFGNGNNLTKMQTVSVAAGHTSIVAGDFNGDGKIDLVSGGDGNCSYLTNNGAGSFTLCQNFTASPGEAVPGMALCDVNSDGLTDLVLSDYSGGGSFEVVTNDGARFGLYGNVACAASPGVVTTADFDGDGYRDIVASAPGALSTFLEYVVPQNFGGITGGRFIGSFRGKSSGEFSGNFVGDGSGITHLSFPILDANNNGISVDAASNTTLYSGGNPVFYISNNVAGVVAGSRLRLSRTDSSYLDFTYVGSSLMLDGNMASVVGNSNGKFGINLTPSGGAAAYSFRNDSGTGMGTDGNGSHVINFYNNSAQTLSLKPDSAVFSVPVTGDGSGLTNLPSANLSATATLDFPSVAVHDNYDLSVAVAGAAVGDVVAIGTPTPVAGSCYAAFAGVNVVNIRLNNFALAGAVNPASATFKVVVMK